MAVIHPPGAPWLPKHRMPTDDPVRMLLALRVRHVLAGRAIVGVHFTTTGTPWGRFEVGPFAHVRLGTHFLR